MLTIIKRLHKFAFFCITLTVMGSAIGCESFPESTFELASQSRLPKWITLPPGLTRADVSLTMNYYIWPWGRRATFILRNKKGKALEKLEGKVRGLGPNRLKHPPPGFPPRYPSDEVITVKDTTEIIEHRKQEPIFYVTDDPAVRKELEVRQN